MGSKGSHRFSLLLVDGGAALHSDAIPAGGGGPAMPACYAAVVDDELTGGVGSTGVLQSKMAAAGLKLLCVTSGVLHGLIQSSTLFLIYC